ncbi:hypothetical protein EKM01_02495 [Flavobacterium sp. RSP46]|uniref:SHOCT domain-containing protein n=1 Tax=Flavobacterium sp. RSP46 TaxID=2497486 RepID=UPI000F88DEAB|nr:SHOCT domain-containing protein [Flavobacterium sp. RSP46]RTY92995.1 hypothetical protein EKM01_02495 [Flavobacterium sp. RSP46]
MEHNVGVGAIVGLVLASSIYVWNNEKFSRVQKTILLIFFIFPPAQWVGILVVLAYNSYKVNNSTEKITERKVEQVKINLDNSISSLKDLKDKGILTDEEYKTKVKKIDAEKTEQNLKKSLEYKQLKSLFDSGILTKEEFENKVKLIKTVSIKKTEDIISEVYDFKVTLINNEILTILGIPEKTNNILGCIVKTTSGSISNNIFISDKYLYEVQNKKIVNFYKPQIIQLKDGKRCITYRKFSHLTKGDFIFYDNNLCLPNGQYPITVFEKIIVKENRLQ